MSAPTPADQLLEKLGPVRLMMFDCDGTLIDSQHNIVAAVQRVFHSIDLAPPPVDLIRRQVGLSAEAAIAGMLPGADITLHQRVIAAFRQLRPQLQAEPRQPEPLFQGIRQLLAELEHPDVFLGIATGKGRRGLDEVLRLHGLAEHFHTLQTPDHARGKPDPEMLQLAMAETGFDAAETVMIGDTTFDMAMARAARTWAIGVAWGYHAAAELRQAGAHAVIDHPGELLTAIQHLR